MSTTQARVLAIIPFYKRPDALEKCRAALAASDCTVEAMVIDNNTENTGFTKACNTGLREAAARKFDYAFLLNQDCYVRKDGVRNMVEFMDGNPRCAICGPRLVLARNEDLIDHAGCAEAYPAGKELKGRKSRGDHSISKRVPWVTGAAMFARVSSLIEFGLMDENMFLVGSDSDWCYSARARSLEVWYCAEAECVHEHGITAQPAVGMLAAIFKKDIEYWRDKWIGPNLYARLLTAEHR